ncbi:siderophore-interacting protein [Saxibacter everestensis]|uniref:Siderophore-interacting protein n=1 Tax=Saxibacter everestensis TaxID=2909229 RepID=A0ABY8QWL9_9MICO|nr:siderophore-interacting protein [Brevibacteriaceae bacterium ZFBP1038]
MTANQPTPVKRSPRQTRLEVVDVVDLTPRMRRIVLGGSELASFAANDFADQYVKLLFRQPGVDYGEPFDIGFVRENLPRADHPVPRTYTVRYFDADRALLALDFVVHGDEGIAGPWAATAHKGDEVILLGPGGAYSPSPAADWHLIVADESALPAALNAVEALPDTARGQVFLEVADQTEEQPVDAPSGVDVVWLHRGADPTGSMIVNAVTSAPWPAGRVHAFVHGEAGFVRKLRTHLREDRELASDQLSISGYWRAGKTDEVFREEKRAEKMQQAKATT